jgi:hypothetical protein
MKPIISYSKVKQLTEQLAQNIQQKGTTQSVVFNVDGTVQKVVYKDAQNNIVGEDDFAYSTNLITETRTRGSNIATYKYHLDTLETEVL